MTDWFASPVGRTSRPATSRHQAGARGHRARRRRRLDPAAPAHGDDDGAAAVHPSQARRAGPTAAGPTVDLAWSLVLDALVFDAEAEIRWLDHCETGCAAPRCSGRRSATPGHPTRAPPDRHEGRHPMSTRARLRTQRLLSAASDRGPRHRRGLPGPRARRDGGARAARRLAGRLPRRARRRHGAVGLGQVHPADARRRPRHPDVRSRPGRGPRPRHRGARRAARGCVVRRSATSSRTSTSCRRSRRRRTSPSRSSSTACAPGPHGGAALRALGEVGIEGLADRYPTRCRAASSSASPSRGPSSASAAWCSRRAHRCARHRDRRGGAPHAAGPLRRRCRRRHGDPRGTARGLGRPGGVPARRRRGRRVAAMAASQLLEQGV